MRFLHVQHHLVRFQQMCCSEETAQIYHSIIDVLYRDVTLRNMDAGEQNVLHTRRQRHTSGAKTQMQWVGEVKKRKCLGVFNRLHGHKPCGHSCSHACLLFLSSPPVCVNDSLTLGRKVIKAEFHLSFTVSLWICSTETPSVLPVTVWVWLLYNKNDQTWKLRDLTLSTTACLIHAPQIWNIYLS